MTAPVVQLQGITKRFAGHTAVRNLTLDVPGGTIFGLLGPNGAGKSTAIRMMMDILVPDEGRVLLFGGTTSGRDLSHRIGYLPEERGLYKGMKVLDHLVFLGEVKGVDGSSARRKAGEWLERLGLGDWAARKIEDLSKGMQQKVQFAGTVLHDPELVILDEPFSGLDPVNSQILKQTVVDLARSGKTVLFSTHIMEQAEKMCDRVMIISRGEKVVDGTMAEVKRADGRVHVALTFSRDAARALPVLRDRSLVAGVDDEGASAEVELVEGADPDRLLHALVSSGVGLSRFELVEPSLQAIFIAKVGAEAAKAAAMDEKKEARHA